MWLASEWHRAVCAVCVLHMALKVAPSSCIRSQSLIALLRFCCFRMNTPSLPLPPPPHTHTGLHCGYVQNSIHCKCLNCTTILVVSCTEWRVFIARGLPIVQYGREWRQDQICIWSRSWRVCICCILNWL